jgi:RNA polymerase sigma factor (sigma-70 family)
MSHSAYAWSLDLPSTGLSFEQQVASLFDSEFARVFRVLHRLVGDADGASDLAQEAFVRLLQRHAMPDAPVAWLITVALNLQRNAQARDARRFRLLTLERGTHSLGDAPPSPDRAAQLDETRRHVRATLARLTAREAQLLTLSAEGYSYREIAAALDLNEGSVGILLMRAKHAFRTHHEGDTDAS